MYFKATRQNGDSVVGSVAIVADLPPAAQDEGDAPIPADEIVTANLLSAKMLDLLEPTTVGPEISEQQGVYIAGNAILSGQRTYTQGCAQCYRVVKIDDTTTATIGDSIWVRLHGPNTEDSVNTALKRGDCTDYTMTAIRNVLGSFPFPKLSTTMFNHWVADSAAAADSLLKYGYTQVAFPRTGDVVVRARNGPTRWNGHAGIFIGWAAGMSSGVRTDSVPIGWANNGNPAGYLPNDTNYTLKTGSTGFKAGASFITKFFRPHTGS
jgi:hypothetical protein